MIAAPTQRSKPCFVSRAALRQSQRRAMMAATARKATMNQLDLQNRIAVVTGYGRDAARTQGDAPADTVIGKPFDFAQVEEVLTEFGWSDE